MRAGATPRLLLYFLASLGFSPPPAHAQLNWDGQTGIVMTPTARTAQAPNGQPSRITAAFHALAGGDVLSTHFQSSLTTALSRRLELGYTRSSVSSAAEVGTGALSSLFDRGFNTLHVKVVVAEERSGAASHMPQIAIGGVARWQKQHLAGALGVATKNADLYAVATRTFTGASSWGVMLNGGLRGTNAALHGLAGNAPEWTVRGFAAAGLVGPHVGFAGVEWAQQPGSVDGMPNATMPATVAAAARVAPGPGWLTVDAAIVRIGGVVAPNVDLQASTRFILGVTVRN